MSNNPISGNTPGWPDGDASMHLTEAKDEIEFIKDLVSLLHLASMKIEGLERAPIQAGLSTLHTRLDCVTESIDWAWEGRP